MKTLWNYIFYFTWRLHKVIGVNVEKPFRYILSLIPLFANNLKKGEKQHRELLDNLEYGFNIGFAYRCMLSSTAVILAGIEICIFFSLDTGLSQIVYHLFRLDLGEDFNGIAFFSSVVILSYLLNELLLGWWKGRYIDYFKEFEKITKRRLGYFLCVLFHLGAIVFCVSAIIFFDV